MHYIHKTMFSKAIKHFKVTDPILFKAAIKLNPIEIEKKEIENHFLALCSEIVGQQLSGKAADVIFDRFLNIFPNKKVTPQLVLRIPDEKFRAVGMSWAKARYIKDLANKVATEEVILENIKELKDEEIVTTLTKIKGIGRWTVEMYLMFSLGRPDVFSFGDLGLQNGIKKVYGI